MTNYFDKYIENIKFVVGRDTGNRPHLCAEIQTSHKDQTGLPVTIFLTKAELRGVLEYMG